VAPSVKCNETHACQGQLARRDPMMQLISELFPTGSFENGSVFNTSKEMSRDKFDDRIWRVLQQGFLLGPVSMMRPGRGTRSVAIKFGDSRPMVIRTPSASHAWFSAINHERFDSSRPLEPSSIEGVEAELRFILPPGWRQRGTRVIAPDTSHFLDELFKIARFVCYCEFVSVHCIDADVRIRRIESFGPGALHHRVDVLQLNAAEFAAEEQEHVRQCWERLREHCESFLDRRGDAQRTLIHIESLSGEVGISDDTAVRMIVRISEDNWARKETLAAFDQAHHAELAQAVTAIYHRCLMRAQT
jgi:hypothetical protein